MSVSQREIARRAVRLRADHDSDPAFLAGGDRQRALDHGVSLNPFSTAGGRGIWQQGWDGVRPANMVDGSIEWRMWERGRQARLLSDKHARFTAIHSWPT